MVKQKSIKGFVFPNHISDQADKQKKSILTRIQKYKRSVICRDKYEIGSYFISYLLNPYIIMGVYTMGMFLCGMTFIMFYYTTLPSFFELKEGPALNGWLFFFYFLIWSIFTLASGYFSFRFVMDFQKNCYTEEVVFTFTANLSVGIVLLSLYYLNYYHQYFFKQGHVDFISGSLTVLLALSELISFPLFISYRYYNEKNLLASGMEWVQTFMVNPYNYNILKEASFELFVTEYVKFWRDAYKYTQLPVREEANALKKKMRVKYMDKRSKFYLAEYTTEMSNIFGRFELDDMTRIIFKELLERVEREIIVPVINVYLFKIN